LADRVKFGVSDFVRDISIAMSHSQNPEEIKEIFDKFLDQLNNKELVKQMANMLLEYESNSLMILSSPDFDDSTLILKDN